MAPFQISQLSFCASGGNGEQKKDQYGEKKQAGKGIHFRFDAFFYLCIDLGGKRVKTGSLYKVGDDEIIQGHRESQEETGEDSGHQVRKGGFVKSVKWGGSKIQGGLIGVAAGLPELRHDA